MGQYWSDGEYGQRREYDDADLGVCNKNVKEK